MYLHCQNVIITVLLCLASTTTYSLPYKNASNYFLSNESPLSNLNIFYTNDNKAIDILNAAIKPTVGSEYNKDSAEFSRNKDYEIKKKLTETTATTTVLKRKIEVTTTPNTLTPVDKTSSNDISLSELPNISHNDDEGFIVGQKIPVQRSNANLYTNEPNPAGVEILRNESRVCGALLGKRISFANETTLMEFPWTALLLYNTNIRYHCGGSLITTKYVLTAAHCVAQEFYELSGVRLGEHDVTEDPDCAPDIGGANICASTVDANVVKIIIHHDYSHLSFKNDIALLRLDKVYYARSFYPICLTTPDTMFRYTRGTVAGWGATEKAIRSPVLLKAEVPVLDISKCREIYRYSVFNDSTEICGSGVNEVDVCKGDSGGAIFWNEFQNGKDRYFQLGIISLGVRRCGDTRFLPAVFTKVSGFYKWIESNLEY